VGLPFRIGLRDRALLALLKGRYWKGLLAVSVHLLLLVPLLAAFGGAAYLLVRGLPWVLPMMGAAVRSGFPSAGPMTAGPPEAPTAFAFAGVLQLLALQAVFAAGLVLAVAIGVVLIWQPLAAGLRNWFMRNREGTDSGIPAPFDVFRKDRYAFAVRVFFRKSASQLPWLAPGAVLAVAGMLLVSLRYATDAAGPRAMPSLPPDTFAGLAFPVLLSLFAATVGFVPVWLRGYAYRPVSWIVTALPGLSPGEVVRLSERMTRGRRMDLFLLDLSFAGWVASSFLLCGTGLLFLAPYYEAVQAEAFARLVEEAEREGYLVRRSRSTRTDPEASRTGFP
jgi:hypothetical protein